MEAATNFSENGTLFDGTVFNFRLYAYYLQYTAEHGLWTPNEAFFHWSPELLGLGRQIGQINSGVFGVFSAKLSAFWYSESLLIFLLYQNWFLIVRPKIPQVPQNLSGQFVCPSPKVLDFNETSPKGFSASKCDVGNWIFSKS